MAICGPSSIEYVTVFVAALRIGAAACPLAPSSTPEQLAAMVRDCGAGLLFVDDSASTALDGVAEKLTVKRVALEGSANPSFASWLAPDGAKPTPVEIDPEQPFNIIYSSGTTGTPKGIVQPHSMRWGHVRRAEALGYGPDSITVVSTPLYSNTTLVSLIPDARARRDRRADAQVRRARLPGAVAEASRHARDACAGAVSPADGPARLRHFRPFVLPHEDLHQCALRG